MSASESWRLCLTLWKSHTIGFIRNRDRNTEAINYTGSPEVVWAKRNSKRETMKCLMLIIYTHTYISNRRSEKKKKDWWPFLPLFTMIMITLTKESRKTSEQRALGKWAQSLKAKIVTLYARNLVFGVCACFFVRLLFFSFITHHQAIMSIKPQAI